MVLEFNGGKLCVSIMYYISIFISKFWDAFLNKHPLFWINYGDSWNSSRQIRVKIKLDQYYYNYRLRFIVSFCYNRWGHKQCHKRQLRTVHQRTTTARREGVGQVHAGECWRYSKFIPLQGPVPCLDNCYYILIPPLSRGSHVIS